MQQHKTVEAAVVMEWVAAFAAEAAQDIADAICVMEEMVQLGHSWIESAVSCPFGIIHNSILV